MGEGVRLKANSLVFLLQVQFYDCIIEEMTQGGNLDKNTHT